MRDRLPLLAGLLALAIAIGVGSSAIADGISNRNRSDLITVTGSAKKRIVSDYVVWDASITSQLPDAAPAAKRLAGWTTQVEAFLRGAGVTAAELSVQPISTETVLDNSGKLTGYKLTRTFEVRSSRVTAIAAVAQQSASLLAQGVPLAAQPPQYVFTKLPGLRPELLAAATKDAQQRARVLVDATGARLGGVRGVNVGVFQVTSPNSTNVSDVGVYDTSTLQKDVTGVVNVTFALG